MLHPPLEDQLRCAARALDGATSENIIALCQQYLALLAEYRDELHRLPDTLELHTRSGSSLSQEDVNRLRKAVRVAIEQTTDERNRAGALLLSFTTVNGYGAVETLNQQQYKGRDDWKVSAGEASFGDGTGDQRMTIQAAVETASWLRREDYMAKHAPVVGACRTPRPGISNPEREPWKEGHDDSL